MSQTLKSHEIRKRFLEFFEKRGHLIIPSASLVTPDEKGITNPTLFNTAGMQPLVPYLLGRPFEKDGKIHKRLADSQKCLRTVDIDDIGDRTHATFFEMLGNWSLGDYFKKEAINWSYEFLTSPIDGPKGDQGLGLDPKRLYVTVFEGDSNAPRDEEAADIWREVFGKYKVTGSSEKTGPEIREAGRIFYLPAKNNWWEAGENGPCGPDTEMYYDVQNKFGGKLLTHDEFLKADDVRDVVEVWNDVFMQYEKKDGKIIGKLPAPSVDTGAGLERLTMTIQGVDNIYDTDLLKPIMELIKANNIASELRSQRIIADHMRASMFLIMDGVRPANTGRGYILRRLLRRAIFNMNGHTVSQVQLSQIIENFINIYENGFDVEFKSKADEIKKTILDESEKFTRSLTDGLKRFEKIRDQHLKISNKQISGAEAFDLFQSFGLPLEVVRELATADKLIIDEAGFQAEFKKHQDLSRAGAEQKFKGGLASNDGGAADPMVIRYHTATHLLHQALRQVLGTHVSQKGSNITQERLRFDFAHTAKMTDEEKKKVEEMVNAQIQSGLPVQKIELPFAEAEKTGALHFFGEKYGDTVSVYYVGQNLETAYSKEFCGGPHVSNTKELAGPDGKWTFKIQKEEAVAQGVRRIKAILA